MFFVAMTCKILKAGRNSKNKIKNLLISVFLLLGISNMYLNVNALTFAEDVGECGRHEVRPLGLQTRPQDVSADKFLKNNRLHGIL